MLIYMYYTTHVAVLALALTSVSAIVDSFVDRVNSAQTSFTAKLYPELEGIQRTQVQYLRQDVLRNYGPARDHLPIRDIVVNAEALPDSYDLREVYPGLIRDSPNQGRCGSCWGVSGTLEKI